jgi:hypothetical protein
LSQIFEGRKRDREKWGSIVSALEQSKKEGGIVALKARQKEIESAANESPEKDKDALRPVAVALDRIIRTAENSNMADAALDRSLERYRYPS